MKRIIALTLALLWTACLCGCQSLGRADKDSVRFYYQRSGGDYAYGQEDSVIASEARDISGNRDNLQYLLTLYFHGPLDSVLSSPFPAGSALVALETKETSLKVTLNSVFAQLEGIDLTIACTCLAMTCFDLCDAEEVLIETAPEKDHSGVSITISRENVLLADSIPETTPATE